jgi:predicted nucleotidyltransferase/ribosomal protein L13E
MRLVSSEVALRIVLALACAGRLTLSELGRAAEVPTSSAKRALEILEEDGLVVRSGHTFALAEAPAAGPVVQLAGELLGAEDVLRIAARATGQVEFAGRDDDQMLVLFDRASDPLVEGRLAGLFERQAERMGLALRLRAHDDLRHELDIDPERRHAYLEFRPVFGDPHQAFPDRSLHGATTGERLGRPNPLLRRPSARALHRLRRQHGIRSAKIFGSAVRTDFRSDSDVDVAIDLEKPPTLRDLIAIEQAFEQLFGRDVDLVLQANARPRVRAAIELEGVEILR